MIRNKDRDPKAYQSYRPAMEKFMVDELMLGHINEDLAFLYEMFISESLLNRRMAENLSRLLFTCQIRVEDPSIRYVLVYHEELKKEEKCPLKKRPGQCSDLYGEPQDLSGGRGRKPV